MLSLFSRNEKWNYFSFHSFREWKVKWKCLKIEIENEKWNENASRSRLRSGMSTKFSRILEKRDSRRLLAPTSSIFSVQNMGYDQLKKCSTLWVYWMRNRGLLLKTFCTLFNQKLFLNQYFSWQNAKLHAQFHSFFLEKRSEI